MWKKFKHWVASIFKSSPSIPAPPAPAPIEAPRPSPSQGGAKALWYPLAVTGGPQMSTSGKYAKGYPEGAIVHFTAGRDKTEQEAIDTLDWGRNQGYVFFVIGPTGKVYQRFPLSHYGSHAGQSSWPGLGSSVSSKLVGIEVACAGKLEAGNKAWFGVTYPAHETRSVGKKANIQAGTYKKYTPEQEAALTELLLWLHKNNPEVFKLDYVLGHDEVSPGRKNDPGGSLSMTMPDYRKYLKDLA